MMLNAITAVFMLLTLFLTSATPIDSSDDNKALGYPDGRKIAQDSQGNLFVAYRKKFRANSELRYHIFVAKSADSGASWQILNNGQPIETTGDHTQRVPSLAIDSQDSLHLVWYGLDDAQGANEREIKYSRSADGGASWTAWRNVAEVADYDNNSLWQEHPLLHIGHNDTLYLIWQGKDGSHTKSQTKFSRSADGGDSWTAWRNIDPSSTQNYSRPTLVSTSDGTLYVLAYRGIGTLQRLAWTKSTDNGDSWATWTAVSFGTADQRHASLIADAQNQLHAVWRQQPEESDDPAQIHYATFDGSDWSWPIVVSPQTDRYQFFPSLSRTSAGQIWVAWTETADESGFASDNFQDDPTTGNVVYALLGENGRFRPPVILTNNDSSLYATLPWSHHHTTALDLIWSENSAEPYQLRHQRLACAAPVAPISQITRQGDKLLLTWTANEANHSYEIWQDATVPFPNAQFVAETADLSILLPLPNGNAFYRVRAVNACGVVSTFHNIVGKFDVAITAPT